jgi:hypothetical protein
VTIKKENMQLKPMDLEARVWLYFWYLNHPFPYWTNHKRSP